MLLQHRVRHLKPGNTVGAAYHAALAVVQNEASELLPNLSKSAGTGIGLELCESGLRLNSKNDRLVRSGMVFNVSLGFQNLQTRTNNPRTEKFSLLLADTVIVTEKPLEVLIARCSMAIKDVAYSINEEEEEEPPRVRPVLNELARQKNKETARRLAAGGLQLQKDEVHVTSHLDNRICTIPIMFNLPGTPFSPHDMDSLKFQGTIYLKEITFWSKDPRHSSEVVQLIKTLRRHVTSRESERAERAGEIAAVRKPNETNEVSRLVDTSPIWWLCKEAYWHFGGPYATLRPDESVDMIFANIKHACSLAFPPSIIAWLATKRQKMSSFM
ncbi:hypothetical protein BHM03_00007228 [Ensete ventricosum]|nr:hypothetical protein BHM03_00007228 [Ensete ventricosum]